MPLGFKQGIPETSDTKPFTVNRDGYIDSRTVLNGKFIKITKEAVSNDEEDAITFPAELKLNKIWYYPQFVRILEYIPHGLQ